MNRIGDKAALLAGWSLGALFAVFGWVSWPLAAYAASQWWDIHWALAAVATAIIAFVPFGGIANIALAVYGLMLLFR